MLKELPARNRPPAGEPPVRRWFFSHEQDLIVWFDAAARIVGFQLCYDKDMGHAERAITWRREQGFDHAVVDDGQHFAGDFRTPFLHPNGYCDIDRVLTKFHALAIDLPPEIVDFVTERLRVYPSGAAPAGPA